MPPESKSAISQLVQHNKRSNLPTNTSVVPVADDISSNTQDTPTATPLDDIIHYNNSYYKGLMLSRLPHLERRQKEHARGAQSWIYRYGWPVYHTLRKKNY
ncbi:hypothetical protein EJ02DRAFT_318329, partial [Clathrospora elynae]